MILERIRNGIIDENPTFIQVVGMCPVLAVTTTASNAIGMGLATTAVLTCSNVVISLIRKLIPDEVRIPCYVVVIASFVTVVQFLLEGFLPALNNALGIFIPLIVVNCIILARAEAYANKHGALESCFDGIGMGLGFTAALLIIGCVRELLGAGALFGQTVLPEAFPRTVVMILPPGAFLTLGFLMAGLGVLKNKISKGRG
ncbi:MAG: electron transport complex subunit E [Clostridiales bacterium]|jgi:electron transport complex protein RnfE|nr:electron transport complex subunit E [Clostridiales bacterium]